MACGYGRFWTLGRTAMAGCYVAGTTADHSCPYLARFDADGNVKWQRLLSFADGQASSVLLTQDNGCTVAGSDGDFAALFKVDQDGGMTPELRQPAPRIALRVAHDLARMRRMKLGLRKEGEMVSRGMRVAWCFLVMGILIWV